MLYKFLVLLGLSKLKKIFSFFWVFLILLNIFSISILETNANQDLDFNIIEEINKKNSKTLKENYAKDRVLVKFKNDIWNSKMKNSLNSFWEKNSDIFENVGIWIVKFDEKTKDIDTVMSELKTQKNIEYVEYDYIRELYYTWVTTNDTLSHQQWYLDSIKAPEAWKIYDDNQDKILVSVNDTGFDYKHPDLVWNLKDLSNPCKTDTWALIEWWCPNSGWNFEWNWNYDSANAVFSENDMYDISWHWTHVAGTIWAVWNNGTWTIWVTQNVEIMWARLETYGEHVGFFYVSNVVRALNFAIENDAKIVNASYWGSYFSKIEYDTIKKARDKWILFVAAAWNDSKNNDTSHKYPSDYDLDNIISVAALWKNDELAYYSNYWATSVDIAAPGWNLRIDSWILATYPFYETIWSHSMGSFSWITQSWTWLTWNIRKNYIIETQSWALFEDSSYTWSEDKTLIFDQTFDLSWAKFAKFEWHVSCDLKFWDNLELLINDQVIWNAYPYWTSSRQSSYWNLEIPIPSSLYKKDSKLKVRFTSNSDNSYWHGCSLDNFKIIKNDDSKHTYKSIQWTSMAAPVVSWIAAMVWSYKPDLSYSQIKDILFTSVDNLSSLNWKVLTNWKVNANNTMKRLMFLYGITKNWTFEWNSFTVSNIDLKSKNITLSWSNISLTSTWNVINLENSNIFWTWSIEIWAWTNIVNWWNVIHTNSNDFSIILKDTKWNNLSSSWNIVNAESLVISYTWSITSSKLRIYFVDSNSVWWKNIIYDWDLLQNNEIAIKNSFANKNLKAYAYKTWNTLTWFANSIELVWYHEDIVGDLTFNYTPSSFTWTLSFSSWAFTNSTWTYIKLESTHYPVNYNISWDISVTLTWTLNNSGIVLVNLKPWDWVKTLSWFLININDQFSKTFTGTIELDSTKPSASISSNTPRDKALKEIEFNLSTIDKNFNSNSIVWTNNLNWNSWTWTKYIVSWETSTGLLVKATFSDLAWNTGSILSESYIIDNTWPLAPYNVVFNKWQIINSSNVDNLSLVGSWNISESGALVTYEFLDNQSLKSSWTWVLFWDSFNISPVNISWLSDWNINYFIYFTDKAWNKGWSFTWITVKETSIPKWTLELESITTKTNVWVKINSSEYPIKYELYWDLVRTYTWVLNNSWSVFIDLKNWEWKKDISMNLIDYWDNQFSSTWSIILDQVAPLIEIKSHTGQHVSSSFIILTWTVLDVNWINKFIINSEPILLNSWKFSKRIDLLKGKNTISYEAFDSAWNSSSWNIDIIRNVFGYIPKINTWSLSNTWSIEFNGSWFSSTWAVFSSTGNLSLVSSIWNNSVELSLSWLTINSNSWNGIFNPPEQFSFSGTFTHSWFTKIDNLSYDIWSKSSELTLSWAKAKVKLDVWNNYNWQTLWIFRSDDRWNNYNFLDNCLISLWFCSFQTNKFSIFALANPSDSSPWNFSFVDVTNANLSSDYISNEIVISWINTWSSISISSWEYSINSWTYTSLTWTVVSWDKIKVKLKSSSSYSSKIDSTLIIWWVSDVYSITTRSAPVSSGGWGWWGSSRKTKTCETKDLVCKQVSKSSSIYIFYRKDSISCSGWNLWKTCEFKKEELDKEKLDEFNQNTSSWLILYENLSINDLKKDIKINKK